MFSSSHPAKSLDNLSPLSPGNRAEYSFHSRLGQGQRPASRRGSTASSIHSIGGALDTTLTGGLMLFMSLGGMVSGVAYPGRRRLMSLVAISTLLQPPIVRTGLQPHTFAPTSSTHKPPTARDIPPVALTNIPQIDPEEFAPYLSQIGSLYEQLRRAKENEEEDNQINRRGSRQDEPPESTGDGYLRPGGKTRMARKGSTASLSSLNSIDLAPSTRRGSTGLSRKSAQGPPPLSTIPAVYFEEDFHLENPRTFDVVSERSEVIRPSDAKKREEGNGSAVAPRKTLATNAILQEKLSWYMDTIEIHLINSISTASTTFFTALGSLKELHSEAAESVERIKTLREELEALDEEVAANGLKIVEKRRRQENLRQLSDAVKQLKLIVDELAKCESLVDAGEVDRALTNIDSLEKLISGERNESLEIESGLQLRDLRSASALQGVNADLTVLRFRIGRAYENKFSSILLSDLRQHVESVSTADVLLRWNNAASRARGNGRASSGLPTYLTDTDMLKAQLLPNMFGLHRAKHITTAASAFREEIFREMRSMVRRPLPSSNEDDNESMISVSTASGGRHLSSQEKSANLARNLRALDPDDAEQLLTKVYVGVTEMLRRLSTQVKVLLEITSSLSDSPKGDGLKSPLVRSPMASPRPDRHPGFQSPATFALQEELHKALDVGNLMAQAVDVAIDRVVKVLKVRSEQATHLPLEFFLRYFTLNLYFTYECEAISGRSGTSLKTVVNGHIKEFVQWHRDSEMQKLAQGMESDKWDAKDFTDKNTELLNQILGCSTGDTEAWTENTRIWIPYQHAEKPNQDILSPETNGVTKEKGRPAVIEMEKFVLPNSAVLCLDGIGSFLQLIAGMPSMTTDIATSLLAYLQLFNSRCTQLILGAGATRSAGLKNITTKHLALASQALSFIASLVPHMREFVRRHVGSGAGVTSLMGEFDRVRRLLQEHQDSIHQKLVDIMSGRAANHAKSVKGVDWDSGSSEGPHLYMEMLVKETTTLHRVLTKHLPETHIQMIMLPVFSGYKDQLGNAFRQVDVKTELGQKRMLTDVEYFSGKLQKLEGFGDTSDFFANIINSKQVTAAELPSTNGASNTKLAEESEKATSSEESSKEEAKA
ncbi:Vacuolar sorting-associated 54-like protein [Cladobotryum mycophilum]|uniref:Vacuolar sorting-associated 54-like protein n=1 Tax=Cladobotryum mycophilum TaxID=491253 RepID=A0ABR0SNS4_9HYPO